MVATKRLNQRRNDERRYADRHTLEFVETSNTVKPILRNNIDERIAHRNRAINNNALNPTMSELISESVSKSMSELEKTRMQTVLKYLDANKKTSSSIAAKLLDVEGKTVSRLVPKAEKLSILDSARKAKNKVYFRE